jgi:hypothetical protein
MPQWQFLFTDQRLNFSKKQKCPGSVPARLDIGRQRRFGRCTDVSASGRCSGPGGWFVKAIPAKLKIRFCNQATADTVTALPPEISEPTSKL